MANQEGDPEGMGAATNPPLVVSMPDHRIILWLSGEPTGKGRPKFNVPQRRVYTPRATELAEADIRSVWREAGEPRLPDDEPIEIWVDLFVSRPKGHFKGDGSLSAEGLRNPRPLRKKPDADNALKLVMDALNSRAYHDDVRVCRAVVEKHWAEWPATKIKLSVLRET